MSDISGYRVGGTIHLIINNQIGFTTAPESARSSLYCTDVAKTVQAPIFHVNGDDPEACVRVARLAFEYRQPFHKDVVIDMVCYRRHGHNEGDDPSYTQPLMYKAIAERRSVRKLYVEALVKRGDITVDEAEAGARRLPGQAAGRARRDPRARAAEPAKAAKPPKPRRRAAAHRDRRRPRRRSTRSSTTSPTYPDGFTLHPKLAKQFEARAKLYARAGRGRLGHRRGAGVRLAACSRARRPPRRRGHPPGHVQPAPRRADRLRDRRAVDPARRPRPAPGARSGSTTRCCREYAALGFEYGYALANQDALVMWEAQFGDFVNGAQIIIDQYLVAAEDKWGQTQRPRAAAAARLRGPGPGALVGAHRAVPHAVRRGQHPGRATPRRRRSTSTCCAARCTASVRKPLSCSRRSSCCA